LEAEIDCRSVTSGASCRNLAAPTATTCDSEESPSTIAFQYTGQACGSTASCEELNEGVAISESQVYIDIVGRDGAVGFTGVVTPSEVVRVTAGLARRITITIYTVDPATGGPGIVLQQIRDIRTECDGQLGRDLTLLQNYGALQLVSFTNPDQGTQSIIELLSVSYTVINEGALTATVASAVKSVPGTVEELLADGEQLLGPGALLRFEDNVTVNLSEQSGETIVFNLFTSGRGTASGRECVDNQRYSFLVAQ
jgi:hypothetical protein